MKLLGILLIIAGAAVLVYGSLTYTTKKKAVDLGPLQIQRTEHHTIPLPPALGIVVILGGGALLYFGAKGRR